jgi:hypothetical protein
VSNVLPDASPFHMLYMLVSNVDADCEDAKGALTPNLA